MERLMNVLSSQQKRQKRGIIAMAVMLFVFFIIFYLNSNKSEDVVFSFILGDEWKLINEWKIDPRTGALMFLVLTLLGVLTSLRSFSRGKGINLGVAYSVRNQVLSISQLKANCFLQLSLLQWLQALLKTFSMELSPHQLLAP
jgi:hypothetical protein